MKHQDHLYTRRTFLKKSLKLAAVGVTVPTFLSRTALAMSDPAEIPLLQSRPGVPDERILVVVQLSGGNDGLNTVIPYSNDRYYALRPTLGIAREKILTLDDDLGLHPAMSAMKDLYEDGLLSVVQGVGYPNPDRSHFRSMEIWQSGVVQGYERTGWIGRLFDHACSNAHLANCSPTLAVNIGNSLNPALFSESNIGVALENPKRFCRMAKLCEPSQLSRDIASEHESNLDFLRRTALNAYTGAQKIKKSIRQTQRQTAYPNNRFGQGLKLIAAMIAGGLDTRVYYISLSGFDTHSNQSKKHSRLLRSLSEGIAAFQRDLGNLGQADRVLGVTFSEFGRRVAENGSLGTDHGQAAPMFLFGKPLKAGLFGQEPDLENLSDGDVEFSVDFRSVYATVLEDWLKADSTAILGKSFPKIDIV